MKFLVDENHAHSTLAVLTAAGHEAARVRGAEDDEMVLPHARRDRAVLVTGDMDFADLREFPLHRHAGIIVLRDPPPAIITTYNALLALFLRHVDVTRSADRLTIVQRGSRHCFGRAGFARGRRGYKTHTRIITTRNSTMPSVV